MRRKFDSYLAILSIPLSGLWLVSGAALYAYEIMANYCRFGWLYAAKLLALSVYFDNVRMVIILVVPVLILGWAIARLSGLSKPKLPTDRW